MPDEFPYDVFLSHSAEDKAVRPLAERLRADALLNNSQPSTFNSQPPRGSDWVQLESGTFRFRDPLNKERRFLPLRLDAPADCTRRRSAAGRAGFILANKKRTMHSLSEQLI